MAEEPPHPPVDGEERPDRSDDASDSADRPEESRHPRENAETDASRSIADAHSEMDDALAREEVDFDDGEGSGAGSEGEPSDRKSEGGESGDKAPGGEKEADRNEGGALDGEEEADGSEGEEDDNVGEREVTDGEAGDGVPVDAEEEQFDADVDDSIPEDVRNYERFTKMDGAGYERVNDFLRARTYITAREWAIARLCADFRTETGVEMTKIGDHLPELVSFMTDSYSPQAVNQARHAFEGKVHKAGATFLYGAMCDFFTAEELDDLMYEVTEIAKFLLEVEGADLAVEDELEAEERIASVMREVRAQSEQLRAMEQIDHEHCPHCGGDLDVGEKKR